MSKEKFATARQLIEEKNYEAARSVLRTIDHPTAKEWLVKLDNLAPAFPAVANRAVGIPPRSFTNSAVIVLVLYFILWLPGFIANLLYLREARQAENAADQNLPGTGCLTWMFYLFGLLPLVVGIGLILLTTALGPSVDAMYKNIVRSL